MTAEETYFPFDVLLQFPEVEQDLQYLYFLNYLKHQVQNKCQILLISNRLPID
jgi:hypothetical protein